MGVKVVVERASDAISLLEGSVGSDRAVIAFAGVQAKLGGIELWEFAKTLVSEEEIVSASQRAVAFVRERPARWYNSVEPGWLDPFVAAQAGKKIVTLGNSMGGFAAILFSLLLPDIRRSIAFCPQYSVHPDRCPWEKRWCEQIEEIGCWRFETCLPNASTQANPALDHVLFCGAEIRDDVRHAELIVGHASKPVAAFIVHGCGHDVARRLKRRGVLVPLLDLLIDELAPSGDLDTFMREQGVAFDLLLGGQNRGITG